MDVRSGDSHMDYYGIRKDLWDMAVRARLASGLGDRLWRMAALAFSEDCIEFFFELAYKHQSGDE